jgi:hypothetical protein
MTAGERLALMLRCPQCGYLLGVIACGPEHAALQADPTRHPLVMDALAEALRESDAAPTEPRPRGVWFDPDDHDRVALLNIRFHRGKSRSDVENMQAALREFLTDDEQPKRRGGNPFALPKDCCSSHVVRGLCCDVNDCGPCCPDCPTCPTLARERAERRALREAAAAIEARRNEHWQRHLREHPYADGQSCPGDYAAHDAYYDAARIVRDSGASPAQPLPGGAS